MNLLEFISSLVWPSFALILIVMFKKNISLLISRMSSLKISGFESNFNDLSVSDQSLIFLDGVSRKEQWTFYHLARENERALSQAFAIIVEELKNSKREELILKLRDWLNSDDANEIWFASEIIGYFKLTELEQDLHPFVKNDLNKDLPPHILNCIWAYARIQGNNALINLLGTCQSPLNLKWLTFVFRQMYAENHITKEIAQTAVNTVENHEKLNDEIKLIVNDLNAELKSAG